MYCAKCRAKGPRVMMQGNEKYPDFMGRVIAAWNARSTDPAVLALVEALRVSARQHRAIAGMDLMGASAVAYNAARDAEAALTEWDANSKTIKEYTNGQ